MRHPEARVDCTGRVLEAGKFNLGFFDDCLAMPDLYGADHTDRDRRGHPYRVLPCPTVS